MLQNHTHPQDTAAKANCPIGASDTLLRPIVSASFCRKPAFTFRRNALTDIRQISGSTVGKIDGGDGNWQACDRMGRTDARTMSSMIPRRDGGYDRGRQKSRVLWTPRATWSCAAHLARRARRTPSRFATDDPARRQVMAQAVRRRSRHYIPRDDPCGKDRRNGENIVLTGWGSKRAAREGHSVRHHLIFCYILATASIALATVASGLLLQYSAIFSALACALSLSTMALPALPWT